MPPAKHHVLPLEAVVQAEQDVARLEQRVAAGGSPAQPVLSFSLVGKSVARAGASFSES